MKNYVQDLIKQTGMVNAKPLKLAMDSHLKVTHEHEKPFHNSGRHKRLIDNLIYLTITRLYII